MQSAVIGVARAASRYRWTVCALLFFATVINYMDRQILGLLAPMLQHDIGWTQVQYGRIVMAFSAFYAIGLLGFGRIVDWLGTRISYAVAMLVWSIAAMLHAAVGSVAGFAFVRALLGIGEGGNFPAAIKTTAEWFPGFRAANARSRPASSTRARTSVRCSRRRSFRRSRSRTAGVRRS
ncbi:putative hexuronate transporter [Burkholderia multivorans]|nr:putative hexuronate transporter [Burkholderia multivorans]SAK26220.1 putative hexuronate transporter [Burkholderia multivorans]SPU93050.1 major facilitator transporter [Burkholderia multivorans]